jgi:transketolase
MLEAILKEFGPVYLRLSCLPLETLLESNYQFEWGKAVTIREGSEISIFSYGIALHHCLEAAKELEKRGISTKVINLSTIAPLNLEQIKPIINNSRLVVVVEQHHSLGSLGNKILLEMPEIDRKQLLMLNSRGLNSYGNYQSTLSHHQLDPKGIYEQIKDFWFTLD